MSAIRRLKRRRKVSSGFTLIEILVSLVVLAIGCLAAISMQTSTMEGGVQAYNLTVASFLAESEIERLQALTWGELLYETTAPVRVTRDGTPCPAPSTPPDPPVPSPPCFTRTLTLSPGYPTSNSMGLSIQVDFPGLSGGGHMVYDTFKTYLDFSK